MLYSPYQILVCLCGADIITLTDDLFIYSSITSFVMTHFKRAQAIKNKFFFSEKRTPLKYTTKKEKGMNDHAKRDPFIKKRTTTNWNIFRVQRTRKLTHACYSNHFMLKMMTSTSHSHENQNPSKSDSSKMRFSYIL